MAFYTKVRKKDKVKLEKALKKKINYVIGIKEGSENSNYILKINGDKRILTILENNKNTSKTIKIVNFLSKNINVPKYYKNSKSNSFFFIINNKKSLMSKFKKGKIKKKTIKNDSFKVGIFLSKLHKICSKEILIKKNNFNYKKIGKYIGILKDKIDRKLYKFISKVYKMNSSFIISNTYNKLPESLCHCDLFKDNVLFKKGNISSVIDFHFSCVEKRLYDISIHINEWCFKENNIDFDKVKYFLVGYSKHTKLKKIEYENIYNFMLITSLRFLVTRLLGNNILKKKKKNISHYLKMIVFYIEYKNILKKKIKKVYKYDRKFFS
ncbi:Homoserine kinase [Candidatus Vidania fulgoroideae]|nr:Homoserine kinase [Candidatus Vidania fulgoroideae]